MIVALDALVAVEVRWPAAGMLAIAVVAGVVVAALRHHRWRSAAAGRVVANLDLAWQSTALRRAHRRYTSWVVVELVAVLVGLAGATLLAMRPVSARVVVGSTAARDVVLCLDVSGSMTRLDGQLLEQFAELAGQLDGTRIALTIWDNSAITVFPLTDDAGFVADQLRATADAFRRRDLALFKGTYSGADGTSLVGDGLVSCLERFDRRDARRARSIVLATDNQVAGKPQFSLAAATAQLTALHVRLFAVAPDTGTTTAPLAQLRAAAGNAGGSYYPVGQAGASPGLARQILADHGTPTRQPAQLARHDAPRPWLILAGVAWLLAGLAALVVRR